jgi:histidinol phosphatase-like enzyme (inositol monophosphatase family)
MPKTHAFSCADQSLMRFVDLLVAESGAIIKKYFLGDFRVEAKADSTPVTIADRAAEERIRSLIAREYPAHGVIGEEFGETNPDAEFVWIIDPIDGTKSFVAGVPLFGTLIGLLARGVPALGVIANPILDFVLCGDNERALLNGDAVGCRSCQRLSDAVLCTTSPLTTIGHPRGANFLKLARAVKLFRAWGDCYGYYLLARGRIDIMTDPVMHAWDSLPLIPIIRGAGGVVTTWDGGDPVQDPTNVVATSPGIHEAVIAMLNRRA